METSGKPLKVDGGEAGEASANRISSVKVGELYDVISRFVDNDKAETDFYSYLESSNFSTSRDSFADESVLRWAERVVGNVIGVSMAKTVIASLSQDKHIDIDDALGLLADAINLLSANWLRFRETIENITQGILMFDKDLKLVAWNRKALTLLDLPEQFASVGILFEDLARFNALRGEYGPGDPESLVSHLLDLARNVAEHRFERARPNGTVLEVYGKLLPMGGFISTFEDITERKKSELILQKAYEELETRVEERTKELRESQQRFRDMLESSSDWYWETDAQHRFSYISDRYFQFVSLREDEVIGRTRWDLRGAKEPESPDGNLSWNKHAMEKHMPFRNVEYSIEREDGGITTIRTSGRPFFSETGEFIGYRGAATDVTSQIAAQQELFRSEKLAALGGLVAGVAHEINTPVGIGLTAATYLEERLVITRRQLEDRNLKKSDLDVFLGQADEVLRSLTTNLRRAAQLVKSFKQVAVDQTTEQARQFNLKEYLDEIFNSLAPRMKRTHHCVRIECPTDLLITCNPGDISQIVTNLVINSLIHGFEFKDSGTITIRAIVEYQDLIFIYEDDGKGIPSDNIRNVFQPFFTTKRGEGGSGLGLHIIFNLVTQRMRGKIEFNSTEGNGVRFTIRLPNVVSSDSVKE